MFWVEGSVGPCEAELTGQVGRLCLWIPLAILRTQGAVSKLLGKP